MAGCNSSRRNATMHAACEHATIAVTSYTDEREPHLDPNRNRRAADSTLMLYFMRNASRSVTGLPTERPRLLFSPTAAQGIASAMRPSRMPSASS